MADFIDLSGASMQEDKFYILLIGLPYYLTEGGLQFQLELLDPSIYVGPENISFLTTDENQRFGEKSGVALIGLCSEDQRNRAVSNYSGQYIGSRFLTVRSLTREEVVQVIGKEGDRQRVMGFRRLLELVGPNKDNMVQVDSLLASSSREDILRAVGSGATAVIVTRVKNVRLRILVVYESQTFARLALEAPRHYLVAGRTFNTRKLNYDYATHIALRTDPPGVGRVPRPRDTDKNWEDIRRREADLCRREENLNRREEEARAAAREGEAWAAAFEEEAQTAGWEELAEAASPGEEANVKGKEDSNNNTVELSSKEDSDSSFEILGGVQGGQSAAASRSMFTPSNTAAAAEVVDITNEDAPASARPSTEKSLVDKEVKKPAAAPAAAAEVVDITNEDEDAPASTARSAPVLVSVSKDTTEKIQNSGSGHKERKNETQIKSSSPGSSAPGPQSGGVEQGSRGRGQCQTSARPPPPGPGRGRGSSPHAGVRAPLAGRGTSTPGWPQPPGPGRGRGSSPHAGVRAPLAGRGTSSPGRPKPPAPPGGGWNLRERCMNLPINMVDTSCHLSKLYKHFRLKNEDAFLEKEIHVPKNVNGLKHHFKLPVGLKKIIAVEDNPNTWQYNRHTEDPQVLVVIGCHPLNVASWDTGHADQLKDILQNRKNIVGIGSTGIDTSREVAVSLQKSIFTLHIRFSLDFSRPLICHFRGEGTYNQGFDLIYNAGVPRDHPIVISCFGGTWEDAQQFLEYFKNAYVGFSPTTLKAKKLKQTVYSTPLSRILLESGAPNFPLQGQEIGTPADVVSVGMNIAEIKRIPPEEVFSASTKNAERIFGFSVPEKTTKAGLVPRLIPPSGDERAVEMSKTDKITVLRNMGYNLDLAEMSLVKADFNLERAKGIAVADALEDHQKQLEKSARQEYGRAKIPLVDNDTPVPKPNMDGRGTKRGRPASRGDQEVVKLGYSGLFKRFHNNYTCVVCCEVDKQHEVLYHCRNGHLLCQVCFRVEGDQTRCAVCKQGVTSEHRCITSESALKTFAEKDIAGLMERNEELEEKKSDLESVIESLQSDSRIAKLTEENRKLGEHIEQLNDELEDKEGRLKHLLTTCGNAENAERAERLKVIELNNNNKQLQQKVAASKREAEQAQQQMRRADEKAKAAMEKAAQAEKRAEDYKRRLNIIVSAASQEDNEEENKTGNEDVVSTMYG